MDWDSWASVVRSVCVCLPLMSCLGAFFLFVSTPVYHLLFCVRQMASRHATSREAQRRATSWSFFRPKATKHWLTPPDLCRGRDGTWFPELVLMNTNIPCHYINQSKNHWVNTVILYKTDYKGVHLPHFTVKMHMHIDMDGEFIHIHWLMSDKFSLFKPNVIKCVPYKMLLCVIVEYFVRYEWINMYDISTIWILPFL